MDIGIVGLGRMGGNMVRRLARAGIRRLTAYCRERNVAHEICGKLVVAVRPDEAISAASARGPTSRWQTGDQPALASWPMSSARWSPTRLW